MSGIKSFRDLHAWQKAFALGVMVYRATVRFPKEERFGLTAQLRRAAVSIASNIAEGYGRGARQDYLRFLRMSRGSLYEVETQIDFAVELEFLHPRDRQELEQAIAECGRLLGGLIRSLEQAPTD